MKVFIFSTSKPLPTEYSFHNTQDIIKACKNGKLPNQFMFNFHPQQWTERVEDVARGIFVCRLLLSD